MTVALIILAVAQPVCAAFMFRYLRARDEQDRLERDCRATELATEREQTRADIQTLLQRVQAPEMAVVQHMQTTVTDENPYPLTEGESVEAQQQSLIAEIERIEREGVNVNFS